MVYNVQTTCLFEGNVKGLACWVTVFGPEMYSLTPGSSLALCKTA